ncbi:hypothetical protein MP228_011853 [Amoeboaphelidium protococcarum]|nr:hypothetical protein MP228_011853 [Amoeboaphelidium protococcarum]
MSTSYQLSQAPKNFKQDASPVYSMSMGVAAGDQHQNTMVTSAPSSNDIVHCDDHFDANDDARVVQSSPSTNPVVNQSAVEQLQYVPHTPSVRQQSSPHSVFGQQVDDGYTGRSLVNFGSSTPPPPLPQAHRHAQPLQQQQEHQPTQQMDDQDKTTLWMGDLEPWMDENFVKSSWAHYGEHVNVKMIRDKFTGMNSGYCFVDFQSHARALKALLGLNGTIIPNTNKVFKLNWASGGGIVDKKEYLGVEYSIFVGDIGPDVDDDILLQTFQQYYPSCRAAKVVTDAMTGLSRGYGFVRFTEESEQQRAMMEMQGHLCGSRAMRISMATPKNRFNNLVNFAVYGGSVNGGFMNGATRDLGVTQGCNQIMQPPVNDQSNTTVFVGGLTNGYVSEENLASIFAPFGPITYVKIPPGKGCGFVSYVHRQSAEQAITQLNGCLIGTNRVRLSWGRNSNGSGGTLSSFASPQSIGNQQLSAFRGDAQFIRSPRPTVQFAGHGGAGGQYATPERSIYNVRNVTSYSSGAQSNISNATTPSPYSTPVNLNYLNASFAGQMKISGQDLQNQDYDMPMRKDFMQRPASVMQGDLVQGSGYQTSYNSLHNSFKSQDDRLLMSTQRMQSNSRTSLSAPTSPGTSTNHDKDRDLLLFSPSFKSAKINPFVNERLAAVAGQSSVDKLSYPPSIVNNLFSDDIWK